MSGRSIVEYFSERDGYRCGYCGSKDTNISTGMWTHVLTPLDYQDLINRGWRRSGCYTYKPTLNQTCCPMYPIRCDIRQFKPSKSQKKVIKRVNRFLNTGYRPQKCTGDQSICEEDAGTSPSLAHKQVIPGAEKTGSSDITLLAADVMDSSLVAAAAAGTGQKMDQSTTKSINEKKPAPTASKSNTPAVGQRTPRPGVGADPSKPPCVKAKVRRREARQRKAIPDTIEDKKPKKTNDNQEKTLSELIHDTSESPVHKLELRLVRSSPRSPEFEETFRESHEVYKNYQVVVHKDKPNEVNVKQFSRFLVDSPLKEQPYDGLPQGIGSFHQHYLLDGKIIAVGVIDILPNCTSSVYLYYDPQFSFLSLGTYSALREIEFTQQLHTANASIQYYYMGFYIQSCHKMRYKGAYHPSFLACPETYAWCPVQDAAKKLMVNKYSRLNEDIDAIDPNANIDLEQVLVLHQRQAAPYHIYRMFCPDANDEEEVKEYASLVGNSLATRMLLFRK